MLQQPRCAHSGRVGKVLLSNFWFGKLRGTMSHCSSLDLSVWVQSQVYLEGLAHRPVHQRSLPQTYRCHVRRRTPFKRLWRPPIGGSGFVGSFSRLSCCLVSAAVCSSLWLTFHHSPRCVLCCSVALPVCMLCSIPVVELVQGNCTSQVDLAVLGELVAGIAVQNICIQFSVAIV